MAMVIAGLNHLDAMMQAVFWLSPNDRLDGARPIDLVEKDPLAVHAAAEMFGEQGAV